MPDYRLTTTLTTTVALQDFPNHRVRGKVPLCNRPSNDQTLGQRFCVIVRFIVNYPFVNVCTTGPSHPSFKLGTRRKSRVKKSGPASPAMTSSSMPQTSLGSAGINDFPGLPHRLHLRASLLQSPFGSASSNAIRIS